jgi:hypothetical protein
MRGNVVGVVGCAVATATMEDFAVGGDVDIVEENWKAIEESRKPLTKVGKPLRKIGFRARKIGFWVRKISIFPKRFSSFWQFLETCFATQFATTCAHGFTLLNSSTHN